MEIGLFTRVYQNLLIESAFQEISKHQIKNVEITANRGSLHLELETALQKDNKTKFEKLLNQYNLKVKAISIHRDTQLVLGPHGTVTNHFYKGNAEEQVEYGVKRAKLAAQVAKEYEIPLVIGLLGCNDFTQWYPWPNKEGWDKQKELAKSRWIPILEFYDKNGIKFAHEIGPQQIAYNFETAEEINEIFDMQCFGFCLDPSNLLLTGVNPSICIEKLGSRIFHVHGKDAEFTTHLSTSGWMAHGDLNRNERGFRFRIPGWGDVNWRKVLTSLKLVGYNGVISIEIEDRFFKEEEAIKKSKEFLEPLLFE